MRRRRIHYTLSLMPRSQNTIPEATPSCLVLPLVYNKKFFYSPLGLLNPELRGLADVRILEDKLQQISKLVNYSKILSRTKRPYWGLLVFMASMIILISALSFVIKTGFVLIIMALGLVVLLMFGLYNMGTLSLRIFSTVLLEKVTI